MVKEFFIDGDRNKKRQMKNFKLLKEKGVDQQFVKIYEQIQYET